MNEQIKDLFSLFQNKQDKQPIFVVSGLPRSGTSLMMMMLEAAGIEPITDHKRTADDDNPRGYYEFEPVRRLKDGDFKWLDEAPGKSVKVISALLQHLPDQYQYKVIFMRRSMPEILASQHKMLVNRGEDPYKVSDQEMAAYFEKHISQVIDWLNQQPNISTLFIDYNLLLQDPNTQVHKIKEFIGDEVDEAKLLDVVDPQLYRERHSSS